MCIFRGFSHVSWYLEHLGTWNLKPCEGLQFWPHHFLHRPAALPCPRGQLLSSHPMGHVTCCCRWLKRQQWTEIRALEIMVENYLTSWKEKTYFQLPTTNPYQQDEESPSFFAMAAWKTVKYQPQWISKGSMMQCGLKGGECAWSQLCIDGISHLFEAAKPLNNEATHMHK